MIKQKFRLKTKDVRYLTKKRQYCVKGIFGFRRIKQYPNRQFNQISCHIWVKLSKNATTRNQIRRCIMKYIENNDLEKLAINNQYYKIFINLDKNKLADLVHYIEWHQKSEWNWYFEKEFESAFNFFQTFLCWQK